jgi:hypothetical protein
MIPGQGTMGRCAEWMSHHGSAFVSADGTLAAAL